MQCTKLHGLAPFMAMRERRTCSLAAAHGGIPPFRLS
jgi:hypothetical protein